MYRLWPRLYDMDFALVAKIWHSSFGKLAITFLNGSVLLADVIYARLLVADALGLPPQDFDMTVAVCAWIFEGFNQGVIGVHPDFH
jgi:hypothetical protein